MSSNLFIPTKIKVGYKKRNDTYTKRLAYIIYFDEKGKLRKETSWNSWRDKNIAAEEYENTPTTGFILNKGVERCNWGHFSSGRSYIRIFDSRGIEFEVTPENLINILMHTDCNKRDLVGEFVYAWSGKELILLPCNSQEYKDAVGFTERKNKNVHKKNLIPGHSYKTKTGEDVIYIGYFDWYQTNYGNSRSCKKNHIFYYGGKELVFGQTNEGFFFKKDHKFLAEQNTTEPVEEFSSLLEKFQRSTQSSKIVKFELVPYDKNKIILQGRYSQNYFYIKTGKIEGLGTVQKMQGNPNIKYDEIRKKDYYSICIQYSFDLNTGLRQYGTGYCEYLNLSEEDFEIFRLNAHYENGKTKFIEKLYDY